MGIAQLLQMIMHAFGGGGAVAGPPTPGTTAPVAGQPGGPAGAGIAQYLPLIAQLLMAGGGAYYGSTELGDMQNIYEQQANAAKAALNSTNLSKKAVRATQPINKELAYMVNQSADAGTANAGMAQSPGAVASGEAKALAPYAENNLQQGIQMAEFGYPYQFARQPPDYISVLDQLNKLGFNASSTYSLPTGTP